MRTLRNNQYEEFILTHVIRPYQGHLELVERVERLVYSDDSNRKTSFNYCHLIDFYRLDKKWWNLVIVRLSKIYDKIDFSFFPDDEFAIFLKHSLLEMGVKQMKIFK